MTDSATGTATAFEDAALRDLLNQAQSAIARNDALTAEATLDHILIGRPEEANALLLMGVLRRMQNRLDEAEHFYRRAIKANPAMPQAHHNLGNTLRVTGRVQEAAACQREAIRLKPNYIEAHLNLAQALQTLGDHAGAEKSYRNALRYQPNLLMAKQGLGAVLNELNRAKEAETVLRQGLAAGTRNPAQTAVLQHNLGTSLKMQRRYSEALDSFARARELVPDMPAVDYSMANTLERMGHLDEAVEGYRAAIARNPLDTQAHHDLNQLLYRLDRRDEFLRSFDEAAALYPEAGGLHHSKGSFLFHAEDYSAAREAFERAAALLPEHAATHDRLALTLTRLGDFDAAIAEHETALRLMPEDGSLLANYTETLIRADEGRKAAAAAERAIAIDPENQHALSMWGLALRKTGDAREEQLNDYQHLVQVFELDPPEGYSDMASFNRDLDAYLNGLHCDRREYLDQTLRHGTQTIDAIFGAGHDLVERLRAQIDKAVAAYVARMKDDAAHPLLRRRRADFRYSGSWSSRLHDCGFHTNHVHPKGWISSAYYIAVPDAAQDDAEKQGWLKFGEPAFDAGFKDPVRRAIKPAPGTLALFPSYMWHGTVPFQSQQSRTTIAFDVVPK